MSNSSWDNGGQGVPAKAGLPLWGKIAIGCGVAFLLLMVTCFGVGAYFVQKVKKDPEGFKKQAMNLVADKVRPDWEDFRAVVEQLRTPEGCQALYAASPALAKTWPTQTDFLEAASRWHKEVVSAPDLSPDLLEHGGLQITREFGGGVRVGWSPKSGRSVYLTFESTKKPGDKAPRRILELDVR